MILELIRQLIRPLTLSLRLTCNMLAGHVVLFLTMVINNLVLILVILSFEIFVCVIQSVVFYILVISYKNE